MKILSIRGSNIASLASHFSLDFENGPLAQSGLFAISGPTGAGKSSILDAMCLALFDETPRLKSHSGKAVVADTADTKTGDRLKSNETRTIVTKGANDSHAEVDFRGIDGYRYRARWSVVRSKRTQLLGKVDISFQNLDTSEQLTELKKATQARIVEKLGLDFQQFRRSIMLAQGEFSAFLRANAQERGELLEQITGTSQYARISKAAHDRARQESLAMKDLETKLSLVTVLDDEARALMDNKIKELEAGEQAQSAIIKQLETELAWHDRETKLAQSVEQSTSALLAKVQQWKSRENPQWTPPQIGDPEAIAKFAADVRTRLSQATRLDALLVDALKLAKESETERKTTEQSRDNLALAAKKAEQTAAATREGITNLEKWLSENQQSEQLAKNWILYEKELRQYATVQKTLIAIDAKQKQLAQQIPAATAALDKNQTTLSSYSTSLETAKQACIQAEAKLQEIPIQQIRADRDLNRTKLSLLTNWQTQATKRHEVETNLTAREKEKSEAEKQVTALQARRIQADARLEQAETDLDRARAIVGLSDRRKELVQNAPCPLCGSTEHPFVDHDPEAKSIVSAQQTEVKQLKLDRDKSVSELAKQEASVKVATKAISDCNAEIKRVDTQITSTTLSWQQVDPNNDLGIDNAIDSWSQIKKLVSFQATIDESNKDLDKKIANFESLSKSAAEARKSKDAKQTEVDKSRKALEKARDALSHLQLESAKLEQEQISNKEQSTQAISHLSGAFKDETWQTELASDPEAAIAQYRNRVELYSRKRKSLEESKARLPLETLDCTAKQEQLAKTVANCATALSKETERKNTLAGYDQDRKSLFKGHPSKPIEQDLLTIESLETQRVERQRTLSEHKTEHTPTKPPQELTKELDTNREKAKEARAFLESARSQRTIDDNARKQRASLIPEITKQRDTTAKWSNLDMLIGSANGSKFRDFAQGMTLRIVIAYANEHLKELRPRYSLMAIPDQNLEIQIIDHDLGDELRTIASLSGGEAFLVSLALALGLAASGGNAAKVETLFIDEGFGTLDDGTMDAAIAVLDALRATGKSIGVISHVERLQDVLGTQVKVTPTGGGISKIVLAKPNAR